MKKAPEFYCKQTIQHNDSNLFQTQFTYNTLYPCPLSKKEILEEIKNTFYRNFRDKVELDTYYVFKIIKEEPIKDEDTKIAKVIYRIEVKKADTANIVTYNYDEYAMDIFKVKNNFWKRLKLAFKYLFRRPL